MIPKKRTNAVGMYVICLSGRPQNVIGSLVVPRAADFFLQTVEIAYFARLSKEAFQPTKTKKEQLQRVLTQREYSWHDNRWSQTHLTRQIKQLFKISKTSQRRNETCANSLMDTLEPHSKGPLYSNAVIGTLALDGWDVTFGTARRGLGGLRPRPVPSSLYQM